ncbi:MAG: hypothetical protein NKF70_00240 [Methanobacterium sp. ERen5]|nr:MAG: hypothetical protein NKF70_00240 [Methanobacterium sp. ERen5]
MVDVCKTVNRIHNKATHELKPFKMREGTTLERDVVRIFETAVYVKSRDAPGEFVGNYITWLDNSNLGASFQKLLNQSEKITARIKLIDNRWEVLSLRVEDKEEELSEDNEQLGCDY